jgi:hypothetical protein
LPLTRQQIFDEALAIARRQKKPCMNDRGWNLFHHKKLRSFTGSWIPVDVGHDMGINIMTSTEYVLAFPQIFDVADEEFVCDLEYIHDICEPSEWEYQLEQFAEAYRLVYQQKDSMKWQRRRILSTHLRAS